MNKSDLVDAVAGSADMSKAEAGRAVDAVLDGISGALGNGDSVALVGFGTFSVRHRAAREGRNPQTGAAMHIACLLYTSPSPRDATLSRMPSSA